MATDKSPDSGFQRLKDIDRVVHEPSRLLILGQLYVVEEADFLYLENATGMTRGNLSSHLSKLEDAGYVEITKEFVGRTPRTVLKLTDRGRAALEEYLADMKRVIEGLTA